jgi:hypothetical protein
VFPSTFQFFLDAVQYAVYELRGLLAAEAPRNFDRLINDDRFGRLLIVNEFLRGKAKKVSIDNGHTIQAPVLGMALDQAINLFDMLDGAAHKQSRELDDGLGFVIVHEKIRSDLVDRVARDVPLKQHLERIFSGFSSRSHVDALSDLP